MTWLNEQAQKSEHVWKISPVGCKTAFLAARRCDQYAVVFCLLPGELPGVQKPQISMLLWTFSCGYLTHFEAFITFLVCLHQALSPCWVAPVRLFQAAETRPHSAQRSPHEHSPCGLAASEFWKPGWGKKKKKKVKGNSVAESSQHCNNFQTRFGSLRYHKIKVALLSTESTPYRYPPDQVWFQSVLFPLGSVFLLFPPFWQHVALSHSSGM